MEKIAEDTHQCNHNLLEKILARLEGVRRSGPGHIAKCPAHEDSRASLSITLMSGGSIRLKCFAGCDYSAICTTLGVEPCDLVGGDGHTIRRSKSKWEFYPYADERGKILLEHVRIPPKRKDEKPFTWCRPDGRGGRIFFLGKGWYRPNDRKWERLDKAYDPDICPEPGAAWFDECRRVPYRLDRFAQLEPGSLVFVVEGEKDVHTVEGLGFVATTGGGAEDWRFEFGEYLRGLDVIVCTDNDDAGRKMEADVIASCRGKAKRIRILRLPGLKEKGDITDWAEAGGTPGKLAKLIESAPDYEEIVFSNRIALIPVCDDDDSDPAISDDPEREAWLRRMAENAGDVIAALWLLFRMLGIRGKHSRIINALIALAAESKGGVNLGLIRAFHSKIHCEYDSDRKDLSEDNADQKSNRVSRDLRRFIDACVEAGVAHKTHTGCFGLLDYWKGAPEHQGRSAIPGRYRLNFLRFALLVLDRAREIGGDQREAREQAAKEVAQEVLAWVCGRVRELGGQTDDGEEKDSQQSDPLKTLERKREAAIRAFRSYAQLLSDSPQEVESAFTALKREVINTTPSELIIVSHENDTVPGQAVAAEIEAERTLRTVAEWLRRSWQEQGISKGQAIFRVRALLATFISALFAGSEFKRKKIKGLAHSLANEAVATVASPLTNKHVGQGEPETGDQQKAICEPVELPPERAALTDYGYRGPAIFIAHERESRGRIIAYCDFYESEHWLVFESFDDPDLCGPVPLSSLFEPHEIFDSDLIDRWREARNGGHFEAHAS